MLDSDYRPLWDPDRAVVRPVYPRRVQAFMYACAKVAAIMDGKMTEGPKQKKTSRQRGKRGR